jgi:hypothetical protein
MLILSSRNEVNLLSSSVNSASLSYGSTRIGCGGPHRMKRRRLWCSRHLHATSATTPMKRNRVNHSASSRTGYGKYQLRRSLKKLTYLDLWKKKRNHICPEDLPRQHKWSFVSLSKKLLRSIFNTDHNTAWSEGPRIYFQSRSRSERPSNFKGLRRKRDLSGPDCRHLPQTLIGRDELGGTTCGGL